jgi:ribose transport system ATP-binding protein
MSAQVSPGAPSLELKEVSKRFPPNVVALERLNLQVMRGQVHAIVGRNGAGKSTMIRIVSGAERADSGMILVNGTPVTFDSPAQARMRGVVTVHQELSLVPQLTVAENVMLNRIPLSRWRMLSWKAAADTARAELSQLGFGHIDVRAKVGELGMADRQAVEVAKALVQRASVLLLDEPTASLAAAEAERLAEMVRTVCARDLVGVVYVSHRIDEVLHIADIITVLRDGRPVRSWERGEAQAAEVVQEMIGAYLAHRLGDTVPAPTRADVEAAPVNGSRPPKLKQAGAVAATLGTGPAPGSRSRPQVGLHVEGLTDQDGRIHGVSFDVAPGEIVAIVGLPGSGQDVLVECVVGSRARASGAVSWNGSPIGQSVKAAVEAGIGFVPGNRRTQGLVLGMSVRENLLLSCLRGGGYVRSGIVSRGESRKMSKRIIEQLEIKAASEETKVGELSGGNQQKVIIGRWLARGSGLLVLDQPTRGIDIRTKEDIYAILRKLVAAGKAVLLATYELEEAAVADRVLLMSRGRIERALDDNELRSSALGHGAVHGA